MPADTPAKTDAETDRIAKVMARAGVASRRDAEKMILEGRVAVNGKVVKSPALDVGPADRVTLDGKPIEAPQETRLWLYYKPLGLVTSEKDEKGRQTVFDTLPAGLPRVMSVGRLDLNSEGLLLLTNDGGLKRRLELPETGWLRKYRVRVNGRPNDATFDPLRRGITLGGEDFQPMEIGLDRQQGANAWLTVGIREGRNREIRRAMEAVKLTVNRLIRVSYGPFRLNEMQPGDVVEVKRKVMREQLGEKLLTGDEGAPEKVVRRPRAATSAAEGEKRPFMRKPGATGAGAEGEVATPRKPRAPRAAGFKSHGESAPRDDGRPKRPAPREGAERKPYAPRDGAERKPYAPREGAERKPYAPREGAERKPYAPREGAERKPYAPRDGAERKPYAPRGAAAARGEGGERKASGPRATKPEGAARAAGKPRSAGFKSHGAAAGKASGFKSHGDRPGGKPVGGKPVGGKPVGGSRPGPKRGPKPGPKR